MTRRTLDGLHPQGWIPTQQVSVEEALRAYTSEAAYVGFAENRTGRLTVGALADFAVIDRDLLTMSPNDIPSAQVQLTVVGGAVVFENPPSTVTGYRPHSVDCPGSSPTS